MRNGILVGAALVAVAANAEALTVNFSGPSGASGNPLAAQAIFTTSGTTLTIVLTNTATTASSDGADVLGGIYFDIAGSNPVFSNGNAALTAGSSFVQKDNLAAAGNPLNNEWMFDSPSGSPINREYAIGATGWPNFNRNQDTFAEKFHGGNVSAGANDDYGLVPTLGITVGSDNVYVNRSVTFTFDLSFAITESMIKNPLVSYGSAGQTVLTPEPATMGALAIGAMALLRRRRRA